MTPQIDELLIAQCTVSIDTGRRYGHSRAQRLSVAGTKRHIAELVVPLIKHPGMSLRLDIRLMGSIFLHLLNHHGAADADDRFYRSDFCFYRCAGCSGGFPGRTGIRSTYSERRTRGGVPRFCLRMASAHQVARSDRVNFRNSVCSPNNA